MRVIRPVTALLLVVGLTGCAAMQKPWGTGAIMGGIVGATAGGTAGGVAANDDAFGNNEADNETRGAAIGIGIVSGGLLGAVLGHLLFDKEEPAPIAQVPPPPAPKPMIVLKGKHFDFNSAKLRPDGMANLDLTLRSLRENADLRISVEGHTDSVGPEDYNMRLSVRRAESVKSFLVGEGIAGDRIQTRGWGELKPVADNSTAEGRAQNRRVEVYRVP
jgi:OOP family OmpA-OmpF porin